jgi:hypothetical protein
MGLLPAHDLPKFGEEGWVNPNYDLYHNADGYHRFNPEIPGMGMQMSRTYADGASAYDTYQQRSPDTMYARYSRQFLADNGISPNTATDIEKFAAMDYAGRLGQWKNQRRKRKFGIAQVFGIAAQVLGTIYGGPWGAAAGAAFSSGIQGGDLGDVGIAAVTAGAGAYAGGALLSSGMGAASGNVLTALTALQTAGPYIGGALTIGQAAINSGKRTGGSNSLARFDAAGPGSGGQAGNYNFPGGFGLTPSFYAQLRATVAANRA